MYNIRSYQKLGEQEGNRSRHSKPNSARNHAVAPMPIKSEHSRSTPLTLVLLSSIFPMTQISSKTQRVRPYYNARTMSGSRDYDDRHSSSYFRRSSTPEEHASTIPRMPAPGGKTKSCRNDWYEELSGVAKPTNSPSSYKHKSSTRLPTKCSYECLEAVSSEPSRRALRAEHGNVRRATDYITKLRPKQRYWSISSADVEAERLSSRKVSLAEKESGSESDSSSHSFERLRPSNSRSFTESKSRSKEGISDLSLSDSAPITQRSLAALLRLEIQYQEVEEMIGLLMDFRRHCSGK